MMSCRAPRRLGAVEDDCCSPIRPLAAQQALLHATNRFRRGGEIPAILSLARTETEQRGHPVLWSTPCLLSRFSRRRAAGR